ncbi:MAG: hypothetical protein GC164_03135 [Phycisphaera sp.]|nr:hypothetical protein [Phycisphaera sp.]
MATSYGALCNDFYVNQKLALKMDLPQDRETILHMFDQVRKAVPAMDRFRRYDGELALESKRERDYRWLALRRTSIRSGHVNPDSLDQAYDLHRLLLEVAPYHLTVSPLDVDYVELLYGFDLECKANHDEVIYEALLANGPMGRLLKTANLPEAKVLDVQPILGLTLSKSGDLQAYFEVKTRTRSRRGSSKRFSHEPISLFLTVRKYGPIHQVDELMENFDILRENLEALAVDRFVPDLLTPIARQITSGLSG